MDAVVVVSSAVVSAWAFAGSVAVIIAMTVLFVVSATVASAASVAG